MDRSVVGRRPPPSTDMALLWVIGSSGLVGRAVWRQALLTGHQVRSTLVPWSGGEIDQLAALDAGLTSVVAEAAGGDWSLAWVAGAGVIGSAPDVLETEARVLTAFLDRVSTVARSGSGPRALFIASSAGGLYAGSTGPPFTEQSPVAPLAPYGHQKLRIEAAAADFARSTGVPTIVGRMTNVYGPGQDLAKAQGLVSQLAKASILRQPISLYVSLDTLRDYVFVDDAAAVIVAATDEAGQHVGSALPTGSLLVKIIGSGAPLSIAALLGEFGRVTRRRPLVVLGDSPNRRFQVHDLRMRSTTWTHLDRHVTTTLPSGIAATVADLSRQLRRGQLTTHGRSIV